ncbi:MAG TPA: tRNA (adenosine(37)-N6)-threonylcarbamoyltransferase complex dimerization subunit type 1 TsaB [Ktedonobacteraceae bacterium]|nr:tRNA (adenosine(37)-N6)-threonylcarbamoyltransferase complex dimerization subunit type 1 TsaB [Ktedonobacteraceae bacterium]
MLLLALDTSTRQASVALCDENRVYGEYSWQVGNNHSVELLERVSRLLAECSVPMSALDGLVVATGPGSFNGVRVAVAAAKTLAFALQKPLVGISTLEMSAAQFPGWPGPICSLLEAGRGELYAACYQFLGQPVEGGLLELSPRQLGSYQMLAPQDLVAYLQQEISPLFADFEQTGSIEYLFCGEISEASRQAIAQYTEDKALFAPSLFSVRHASRLAYLARQRFAENRLDDPLLLEPLYLRRPSITTSARKQPLLGGKTGETNHQNDQHSTEREEGALRH